MLFYNLFSHNCKSLLCRVMESADKIYTHDLVNGIIKPFLFLFKQYTRGLFLSFYIMLACAESNSVNLTIMGKIQLSPDLPSDVNTDGLDLQKAEVVLRGAMERVSLPYPADYREMSKEERAAWYDRFKGSKQEVEYKQRIEEAQQRRFSIKTTPDAEGNFSFPDIKPGWYEVSANIYHEGDQNRTAEFARAYAIIQANFKADPDNADVGTMTLKLRNVLLPGDDVPEVMTPDKEGGFKLSNLRGNYVLIDFWATWCAPCIREMPHLKAAHEAYAEKGLKVVGFSIDKDKEKYEAFLKKNPTPYRQVYLGAGDATEKLMKAFGKSSIPAIWLIDPEGKLVARDLKGDKIKEALKEIYGE